jgi:hypothetical protein
MTATTNGRRTQQAQLCRWFIKEGLIASSESRTWQEDVDWVFHESGRVLSPAEVENSVATLRAQGMSFVDRVPPTQPALPSKCDL